MFAAPPDNVGTYFSSLCQRRGVENLENSTAEQRIFPLSCALSGAILWLSPIHKEGCRLIELSNLPGHMKPICNRGSTWL